MKRGAPLARGKPLARGSGLTRGKPLERGSGLSGGSALARGKPLERGDSQLDRSTRIAPRSKARAAHMRDERVPMIERLVAAGVTCEIGPVLADLGITKVRCTVQIGGMHERRKSGAGGSRVNPDNLMAACNACNGYLEDCVEPERTMVEDAGLVVRTSHPDWDRFSKRHDRISE